MYDGSSYEYYDLVPRGNASQPAQPKMPGNYPNENYPNPAYGHMAPMAPAGRPYFGPDMQSDRRPLQQIDNPSLIGKVAQRHQANVVQTQQRHGYSQQQMCQPLNRQTTAERLFGQHGGHGLGHCEPVDAAPDGRAGGGYQHQQPSMGYSQDYSMDTCYSQESQPPQHSRAPSYGGGPTGPSSVVDVQQRGYALDAPRPGLYSNFTPMYTSSPNSKPRQHMYDSQRSVRAESMAVTETPTPPCQPPATTDHSAGLWVRPTGLVNFERAKPGSVVPAPRPPKSTSISSDGLSSGARPTTPTQPAPFSMAASPSASTTGTGSERGGARRPPPATPARGIRVLTGTVDNILTWGKTLDEETRPDILFEIVGYLDSVMRGQWHSSRLICLRSLQTSSTLTAAFWEIDRPLFPPPVGSVVACICRLGPKWPQTTQLQASRRMPRMQVLAMKSVSPGQVAHYKRLAFVSSQSVQQGALNAEADGRQPARSRSPSPAPAPLKQTLISSFTAQQRKA